MTSFWIDKRVLVTGGAGFIGSHLVARLLSEGVHQVRAVDNLERGRKEYLQGSLPHPRFEFRQADLRDSQVAQTACQDIDVVFHLASKVGGIRYYVEKPGEVFRDNTQIDHNTWSAAMAQQVPFYLYASSAHVYPKELQTSPDAPPIVESQVYPANPELSYGWAKLMGEQLIEYSMAQGCVTRAALPRLIGSYGPHQDIGLKTGSAIPVFCRRAIEYPACAPFTVLGTGTETRSFHYITDTLDALLLAVEKLTVTLHMPPFNLGSEGRVTIREIAETVIAISGKSIKIQWDTTHPTVIWGQAFDCSLAAQLLDGWRPRISLHEGLEHCYRYVEQRLKAHD